MKFCHYKNPSAIGEKKLKNKKMNINVKELKAIVTELQDFICIEENYGNILCM